MSVDATTALCLATVCFVIYMAPSVLSTCCSSAFSVGVSWAAVASTVLGMKRTRAGGSDDVSANSDSVAHTEGCFAVAVRGVIGAISGCLYGNSLLNMMGSFWFGCAGAAATSFGVCGAVAKVLSTLDARMASMYGGRKTLLRSVTFNLTYVVLMLLIALYGEITGVLPPRFQIYALLQTIFSQ